MPELHLIRAADHLTIRLGERSAAVPWNSFLALTADRSRIKTDPIAYGQSLYDFLFADSLLHEAVTALPPQAPLRIVSGESAISSAAWEYLTDRAGRMLAADRILLRALPEEESGPVATLPTDTPLAIVAAPVAPINDEVPLNTEGEWERLIKTVQDAAKAVALTRVRPPTLTQLGRALSPSVPSIVHFMGHSASKDGRTVLAFEDRKGRAVGVDAADFAAILNPAVLMVVLNSCHSAEAAEWTEFGNLARGLVRRGLPYAMGMQFVVPDVAALEVTNAFYAYLLQGYSIEEAVQRMRGDLARNEELHNARWLAGIPVLYTSQSESAPPIDLRPLVQPGEPAIRPDPAQFEAGFDLTALPSGHPLCGPRPCAR